MRDVAWLALVIAVLIGLVVLVAYGQAKKKEAFMAECLQDHKAYECEALWGQAQPDTTVIYLPTSSP